MLYILPFQCRAVLKHIIKTNGEIRRPNEMFTSLGGQQHKGDGVIDGAKMTVEDGYIIDDVP